MSEWVNDWANFDFGTEDKPLIVKELPRTLVTFETSDSSDEGTWPDQQKDNDIDKDKDNDKEKYV